MQIGLIGAGNMAAALVRGWGEPVLVTDAGSGKAAALAREVGGEALGSNVELARRADIVVLAHKPAQLERVAAEIGRDATAIVSLLARTSIDTLRAAYKDSVIVRAQPNLPVEMRRGVTLLAETADTAELELLQTARTLFERVGCVVNIADAIFDAAAACSGVGPAYAALVIEAQVDAAVRCGVPAKIASQLVSESTAGSVELLRQRNFDTGALRRAVASPGGTTARGLAALERGGIRAAFSDAIDAVLSKP